MARNKTEPLSTSINSSAICHSNDIAARKRKIEQQVKTSPMNCEAQFNLAEVCLESNEKDRAERLFRLVCKLAPAHSDARKKLIGMLLAANKPRKAGPFAAELIAIDAEDAESLKILAAVEFGIGNWENALVNCNAAIAASDDKASMLSEIIPYYVHCARLSKAEAMVQDVLTNNPDDIAGIGAKGSLHYRKGEFSQAVEKFQMAIKKFPDDQNFKFSQGLHQLATGDVIHGLAGYANRKTPVFFDSPECPVQPSKIDQVHGKSMLLVCEQGIGDILQFLRFVPRIHEVAHEVHLYLRKPLQNLVKLSYPDISLCDNFTELPKCDFALSLMDVPRLLEFSNPEDFKSPPYLRAEHQRVEKWQNVIGAKGYKIGLCWQGNPTGLIDLGRSVPLTTYKPISKIEGVRLISLQHGVGVEQIADNPAMNIETLQDVDTKKDCAFLDTAAIMKCLDLIVTTDTSTAHLAGALGCPVLLLLKKYPDWRWILGGKGHVWYENVQLFPQEEVDDWDAPIANIVHEIELRKTYDQSEN